MATTLKQEKMSGIDDMIPSQSFRDLLNELCSKHGQGSLADQIGMDAAQFSRFKNGDGNISMKHLEALLAFSEAIILPENDVKRLIMSFFTVNDLWKKSMGL